jgi:quinol monooxygenase YgiN
LKPDAADQWLRLMLDHDGLACVVERGMLRYWLHRDDEDPAHIFLYEHWADRADETPWEPLNDDGLPRSLPS